jgi:Winged helix-turn helix
VRPLTDAERQALEAGRRSADAFRLRRRQILRASARGEQVPRIAHALGCDPQTVRTAIQACTADGRAALTPGSPRADPSHRAFAAADAEQRRGLLPQSPRRVGNPTRLWTLELAADVSFAEGLTAARVRGETSRATLPRLGVRGKPAKRGSTSPAPA